MATVDLRNIDANAVVVGPRAMGGVLNSVALTNGTILVGKTGYPPVAASIGSSDGSIDITGGAGSIDITVDPAVKDKTITSADGSVDLVTGASTVDLSVDPTLRDKAISSPDASVVVTTGPSTVTLSVAAALRDKAIASADHSVSVTTTSSVDLSVARPYNYLFNGGLEIWGAGTTAAPTGWTLTGAGASVAQQTGAGAVVSGLRSAQVTRAGTNCWIVQDALLIYPPALRWAGKTITLGCWVQSFTANVAALVLNDGVAQSASAYHSGSGAWEFLTVTLTVASSPTQISALLSVANTNASARFDGATLVMGATLADSVPSGWQGRKAVISFSSGATTLGLNPSYYGLGAGGTTDFQYFLSTPFKGVARNLYIGRSAAPAFSATDTLRIYTGAVIDTALTATLASGGNTASDTTHEVEVPKGAVLEMKTTEGAGYAHCASLELEEIP
jgi:hypothetical protein